MTHSILFHLVADCFVFFFSHGIDYKPEIEDLASKNERRSVRERIDLPPWRQRNNNPQSSRDYQSLGRKSYDHEPSWRDLPYECPNQRSSRQSSGSFHNGPPYRYRSGYYGNGPRDSYYNNDPRDSYYDNGPRDSYYDNNFRDSNYGNRHSYHREYDRSYNSRGLDSNSYSRDHMPRNLEQYPRNNRYHPYPNEGHHTRQWQR